MPRAKEPLHEIEFSPNAWAKPSPKDTLLTKMAVLVGARLDPIINIEQAKLGIPLGENEGHRRKRIQRWTRKLEAVLDDRPVT